MEPKFKTGDVVQLNSGGPEMTVISLVKETDSLMTEEWYAAECSWYNQKEAKFEVNYFKEDALSIWVNPMSVF